MTFQASWAQGRHIGEVESDQPWLDFRGGIMTASLGHGAKPVMEALGRTIQEGLVNSYTNYSMSEQELHHLLFRFCNIYSWRLQSTGAEAIDRVIQIVGVVKGRLPRIAVVKGGFHGKSLYMAPARYDCPWGNPLGIVTVDPDDLGAAPDFDVLLFEPVQSLTGHVADEAALRELCNDRAAFLVADEMVTGFYRCGVRFASELADFIVSGKGLGQGVPLAVLGMPRVLADVVPPVDWSTTAAGNNLCTNIGAAVLRHLLDNEQTIAMLAGECEYQLRRVGCRVARGALGFYYSSDPARLRGVLHDRRILATVRDDGVLRLGPSFETTVAEFDELKAALEEAE